MISVETVTSFLFIFARMSGCILFNPIFGRRNLPAIVKAAMILVLTLVMSSYSTSVIPEVNSVIEYIVIFIKEILFGFVLGFSVSLFTTVLILGGELIDFQMGLSMSKIYDVQSNISMALSSTFYNILFVFIFFAVNGHLTMLRFFLLSDEIVPFGGVVLGSEVSTAIIDLFCQIIILSIKLSLPIVVLEFLFEIGVGILMKIIPQINIFVVSIQLKILIGLIAIYAFLVPASSFLENLIVLLFDALKQIMNTMK